MDLKVNRIEERINELGYGGKLYQMQLRETEIEKQIKQYKRNEG